jgi:Response regulator receiver domain.
MAWMPSASVSVAMQSWMPLAERMGCGALGLQRAGHGLYPTLQRIRAYRPNLPIILVSGSVGEETAVELLHLGMSDFVLKGSLIRLLPAILRALNEADERRARQSAETAL